MSIEQRIEKLEKDFGRMFQEVTRLGDQHVSTAGWLAELQTIKERIDGLDRRLEFAERSISATTYRADNHDARIVKLENPIGKAPLNTHTTFDDAMKAGPTTLNHVVTPGPSPMVDHIGLVKPPRCPWRKSNEWTNDGQYAEYWKGNVVFDSREPEVVEAGRMITSRFHVILRDDNFDLVTTEFGLRQSQDPVAENGEIIASIIRDLHAARDRIKALESELANRPIVRWVPSKTDLDMFELAMLGWLSDNQDRRRPKQLAVDWLESCQRDLAEPPAQSAEPVTATDLPTGVTWLPTPEDAEEFKTQATYYVSTTDDKRTWHEFIHDWAMDAQSKAYYAAHPEEAGQDDDQPATDQPKQTEWMPTSAQVHQLWSRLDDWKHDFDRLQLDSVYRDWVRQCQGKPKPVITSTQLKAACQPGDKPAIGNSERHA